MRKPNNPKEVDCKMLSETEGNQYNPEPSGSSQTTASSQPKSSVQPSKEVERQHRLHQQTEAFLQGKISAQELEKVVEEEDVNYEKASFGLISAAGEIVTTLTKLIKILKF